MVKHKEIVSYSSEVERGMDPVSKVTKLSLLLQTTTALSFRTLAGSVDDQGKKKYLVVIESNEEWQKSADFGFELFSFLLWS